MGVILFGSIGLLLVFSLPLIAGLFARSMGRSFQRWFIIGLFLPLIAIFILFFLPDLSAEKKDESGKP